MEELRLASLPSPELLKGFRASSGGLLSPRALGSLQAHMPVPVFPLDAKDILTRVGTRFSDWHLAANPLVGEDADYFESIPFQKVYHDSWMSEGEKGNIKFHGHAEVIVPGELDLDALQLIGLGPKRSYRDTAAPFAPSHCQGMLKMRHGKKPNLHFCKWSFVESATLEQNSLDLVFNASTLTPGPFAAYP